MTGMRLGEFVKSVAAGAGEVLLKYFNRVRRIERKLNAGIVTEADKYAEDYILKRIFRSFPDSSVITEESGEYKRESSLCWIIDPLDGTTNYAHGFPWFCVSIAVYEGKKGLAGAIYQPTTGEMFSAVSGHGARLNGKRIHVTRETNIEDALLGTGFRYATGEHLGREIYAFHRVSEVARGVRRPGAAALDLAFVACGRYDGFWERGLSPWDVAAGFLLVEEAGGKISDYRGSPTGCHDGECVASNGKLHGRLIRLLKGTGSKSRARAD